MFKDTFALLLLVSSLLIANGVQAKSGPYWDVQSGSLMGLMHGSLGYTLAEKHDISIGLGYVPELDYHEEMALYSVRYQYQGSTQFAVKDVMSVQPFRFGIGVLIAGHEDLFVELPDQYPDGYYTPTAVRLVFNYQAVLNLSPQTQAYLDISILDVGLLSYVREPEFFLDNYDMLGLEGITNWGFGVRHQF
jgi:hypothetical protein